MDLLTFVCSGFTSEQDGRNSTLLKEVILILKSQTIVPTLPTATTTFFSPFFFSSLNMIADDILISFVTSRH